MLYRPLGKSGIEVSNLGFGCMRLPIQGGSQDAADIFDPGKAIDEEEAVRLIRQAIAQGVNYFDTAYGYHSGKSEPCLGKAVQGRREKIMLATKLPCWLVEKQEDFDRLLNEQLQRLNTPYVDFYLLHALGRKSWAKMKELGVSRFLDRIRADGRARHVGFSFHDDRVIFKEIVDGYDWTLCQIQYNYLDQSYQAGREGLEYAAAKGLGVVVMEPLRGGRLADKIPEEVQALWDEAPERRSPAEWALRWVWNHRQVATVLSGMNSMEQLQENLAIARGAEADSLSGAELALIDRVTATYKRMLKIDCTACAYCLPCPQGVNIPQNFRLYNDLFLFKDRELNFVLYNRMLNPEQRAANCVGCRECEKVCPQHLKIIEGLKKVHATLAREN